MRTIASDPTRTPGLYRVKPAFVRCLEPVTRYAAAHGITPTRVTVAAIPLEVTAAILLVLGSTTPWLLLAVPPVVLAWMGLNAIDGSLARSTGAATARGAALNELVDRLGDLMLIAAAFVICPPVITVALAAGVLSAELVSALEWAVTGNRVFVGPMGKPDRAAVVAVVAVVAVFWSPALTGGFVIVAVGSWITTAARAHHLVSASTTRDLGGAP